MQAVHRLPFKWGGGPVYTKLLGPLGDLVSRGVAGSAPHRLRCVSCCWGVSGGAISFAKGLSPLIMLTWILY